MLVVFSSPEFGCNHWVISVGKGISHVWDEVHYSCFFFFQTAVGVCSSASQTRRVWTFPAAWCSEGVITGYDWMSYFCHSRLKSLGAFTFVAGRSLISSFRLPMDVLQRMTASSLLFTWNRQRHKVSSEIQFRKSPLFTLKCQFIMQTYLKLKQSNKTTLQIILPSWRLTSSILV